jgi:hypothetical protein
MASRRKGETPSARRLAILFFAFFRFFRLLSGLVAAEGRAGSFAWFAVEKQFPVVSSRLTVGIAALRSQ